MTDDTETNNGLSPSGDNIESLLKLSVTDPSIITSIRQAYSQQLRLPQAYFEFPGTKGSMIGLPPLTRWPSQNGWSFSSWFLLEPKSHAQPYLYNFKTGKSGLGFSAHFTGNCLVLTSIRVKGKGIQHCVSFEFPYSKWIHCAITYHNKWRTSAIKVYVNGQLSANIEMQWQVQTSELFDKCFIGGSGVVSTHDRFTDVNCFKGRMSSIYLFNEGLSPAHICAIHRLGPSYMGTFKNYDESIEGIPEQITKVLQDEKLSGSLFCLYTPKSVDESVLCIQSAPTNIANFVSSPHAALLNQTKAVSTLTVCSTLLNLGISKTLLPLLDTFAKQGNSSAYVSLLELLCDLLETSPNQFNNELVTHNGFIIVSQTLKNKPEVMLTQRLLLVLINLSKTLLTSKSIDSSLIKQYIDNMLFNPSLWIQAEPKVQIELYTYLANDFLQRFRFDSEALQNTNAASSSIYLGYSPTTNASQLINATSEDIALKHVLNQDLQVSEDSESNETRRVSTIFQLLHSLKFYYWVGSEPTIKQKAKDVSLRSKSLELFEIRSLLLKFIYGLIKESDSIPYDEIQGILNYIISCKHQDNLIDVLNLLEELLVNYPEAVVPAIDEENGIKVFFSLLDSEYEHVKIKVLRLICLFLSNSSFERKQSIMNSHNLFMLLCEKFKKSKPLTMNIYEGLMSILTETEYPSMSGKTSNDNDVQVSDLRIENSILIKVVATLLSENQKDGTICDKIKTRFINDLWNLIANSRENRRAILQMSIWQHWLIHLIDQDASTSQLVYNQVIFIFRVLLYHAIRYETGGWRVWIDTLAIIHTKFSYDEFYRTERDALKLESNELGYINSVNNVNEESKTDNNAKIESDTKIEENEERPVSSISEKVQNIDLNAQDNPCKDDHAKLESEKNINSNDESEVEGQFSFTSITLDNKSKSSTSTDLDDDDDDKEHEEKTWNRNSLKSIPDCKLKVPKNETNGKAVFKIPEFKWNSSLIKLLNDLIFSIECDLYHWRCEQNSASTDSAPFTPKTADSLPNVNSQLTARTNTNLPPQTASNQSLEIFLQRPEIQVYIVNIIHFVSQLVDNIIIATGGILPLLAEATGGSKTSSIDKSSQSFNILEGLTSKQSDSILFRLINTVDMVVFAANHINLLELEAEKNTTSGGILRQCLRLTLQTTVKNCLYMVSLKSKQESEDCSKLEFPKDVFDSYQGCSILSANGLFENSQLDVEKTDLIANIEYSSNQTPNTTFMPSILPFQPPPIRDFSKLLQSLDINRIQACIYYNYATDIRQSQFLALTSLYFISVLMVSKYRDIIEPKQNKKLKVVTPQDPPPEEETSNESSQTEAKQDNKMEEGEEKVDGPETNGLEEPSLNSSVSSVEKNMLKFGNIQPGSLSTASDVAPTQSHHQSEPQTVPSATSITEILTAKLENTLDTVCPLLKSIMCDFSIFLSKTLLGSHGQDLVLREISRTFKRQNASPVELVMLLCSQEWQNTLQKNAGLAFIELINEGRILSINMKEHIVRVAMEADFILNNLRADDIAKHEIFNSTCTGNLVSREREEILVDSLIRAEWRKNQAIYEKFVALSDNNL